jgi:hypothetical protein
MPWGRGGEAGIKVVHDFRLSDGVQMDQMDQERGRGNKENTNGFSCWNTLW